MQEMDTKRKDPLPKFVTLETAVQAVRSGDWVDYGFGVGFPELLDHALAARKGEVRDVKVRGGLVIRPRIEIVESDPEQESFTYYSWHIGDYERKLQTRGLVKFLPVMLRSLPYLYRDKHIRCGVAFVPVSRPDEDGYCGLGISNYAWRTIFESARTVIFEINEHYPRLQGVDGSHRVHLSEADYVVEGVHELLPMRSYRAPSETDVAIAKLVVEQIPDGAGTRQLSGIGGQMDFLEGAYRSRGRKGFICINASRVTKDGERKSNIVAAIPSGSTVSAPRTMIQHVATECGIAVLSGKSLRERAEAMAAIAHPDFREKLMKYARENFR